MKTCKKTIRIILWILICAVFVVGLLYFINGSLETFPTPEQQEKARIVAIIIMVISAFFGAVLFFTRKK